MGLFGSSKKKEEKVDPKKAAPPAQPQQAAQGKPAQAATLATGASAAPATSPDDFLNDREKLIRISATFLANPNIEKESLELKTAFLKKKGLTDDEVKKAFDLYKDRLRMAQEEKELKEELESAKLGGKTPQNLQSRIKRAQKTGFLSLKDWGLTTIPPEIFDIPNLHTLILSDNQIETIPPQISKLKNLKNLQLASCGIFDDGLPQELATLPLEELSLASNGLNTIDLLTRIPTLKKLNLQSNDILTIPATVARINPLDRRPKIPRAAQSLQEQHHRHLGGNQCSLPDKNPQFDWK